MVRNEIRAVDRVEVSPPDVSVAIATFNRADMLRDALESLLGLETGGSFAYEIIVVDNASTDATPQVVQEVCIRPRSALSVRASRVSAARLPKRSQLPRRGRRPSPVGCIWREDRSRSWRRVTLTAQRKGLPRNKRLY